MGETCGRYYRAYACTPDTQLKVTFSATCPLQVNARECKETRDNLTGYTRYARFFAMS